MANRRDKETEIFHKEVFKPAAIDIIRHISDVSAYQFADKRKRAKKESKWGAGIVVSHFITFHWPSFRLTFFIKITLNQEPFLPDSFSFLRAVYNHNKHAARSSFKFNRSAVTLRPSTVIGLSLSGPMIEGHVYETMSSGHNLRTITPWLLGAGSGQHQTR